MNILSQQTSHAPHRGFSLIEMLVVVSIVAIFASVVVQSFRTGAAEARDAQRKAILQELAQAAELFHARTGCYPSDIGYWDSSVGWGPNRADGDGWNETQGLRDLELAGIINELPDDPINNDLYHISYEPHCGLPGMGTCKQGHFLRTRLESTGSYYYIRQGVQSTDSDCDQYCHVSTSNPLRCH